MDTQYLIRATHHFFGPPGRRSFERHYYAGIYAIDYGYDKCVPLVPFDSRDTALRAAKALDEAPYSADGGESGRPDYAVIPLNAAPKHIKKMVEDTL